MMGAVFFFSISKLKLASDFVLTLDLSQPTSRHNLHSTKYHNVWPGGKIASVIHWISSSDIEVKLRFDYSHSGVKH